MMTPTGRMAIPSDDLIYSSFLWKMTRHAAMAIQLSRGLVTVHCTEVVLSRGCTIHCTVTKPLDSCIAMNAWRVIFQYFVKRVTVQCTIQIVALHSCRAHTEIVLQIVAIFQAVYEFISVESLFAVLRQICWHGDDCNFFKYKDYWFNSYWYQKSLTLRVKPFCSLVANLLVCCL